MSEVPKEHSSPIKTPKQLLIVIVLAFLVPIVLIILLSEMVTTGSGSGKANPALTDEAVAARLKPIGRVEVVDPNAPKAEKSGKEIVEAVCSACHATGALNAPKIGDKAAWGKLIAEGLPSLTKTAIKGERNMPPRGGNPDLTDSEIARAVAYMANQAGANFQPPATKSAPAAAAPAPAAPPTTMAASPTPAAAAPNKGKAIYDSTCVVCHGAGIAGAPKAGDKAAWAPRL